MKEPREASFLPAELLWAEGDHASDVVLTALADGEHAIVPPALRAHVERCPVCSAHLGHAALLSLETQRSLDERLAAPTTAPARRPFPRLAVALGLVLAVLGLVPGWTGTEEAPARVLSRLARAVASLAVRLDASGGSAAGLILMYVVAGCLVLAGLALARLSPKKEVSR